MGSLVSSAQSLEGKGDRFNQLQGGLYCKKSLICLILGNFLALWTLLPNHDTMCEAVPISRSAFYPRHARWQKWAQEHNGMSSTAVHHLAYTTMIS
jgi:hypothetical protein